MPPPERVAAAPTLDWLYAARFLSGLPHGAYFGVASLVAAVQAFAQFAAERDGTGSEPNAGN